MTKAEVIASITTRTGADKEPTSAIVEQFFKIVNSALENGEDVFIRGFGTFMVKKRNQTLGRNIHKNTPSSYPNIVYQYLTLPGSLTIK
jgi:DNA-binding protein HU-beta